MTIVELSYCFPRFPVHVLISGGLSVNCDGQTDRHTFRRRLSPFFEMSHAVKIEPGKHQDPIRGALLVPPLSMSITMTYGSHNKF